MAAATVGALRVDLGMNSAQFEAGVKRAEAGLDQFSTAAGRAGAAATKMGLDAQKAARMASFNARNLSFQLIDIGQSIPLAFQSPIYALQNLGFQLAQIGQIYMGQGGFRQAFVDATGLIGQFATKLAPVGIAVGVAVGSVAALTHEINKASDVQVSFGDTALATWQVFSESIYEMVGPALNSFIGWLGGLWETVRPAIVAAGNGITATFVGAFNALVAYWSKFPQVIGDIVFSTANLTINGVEAMINGAVGLINEFTQGARGALAAVGIEVGDIGSVSFGNIDNPFAGTLGNVAGEMTGAFTDAFSTDFLGNAFDAIKTRAIALASATDVASESLKAANDNASKLGKTLNTELADAADKSATSMMSAFGQLTGSLGQLFNDNKAFAVASAVINTAEGITKALAQGGALGFVSAAAVAASGAAQIATILSSEPGRATAPSVGGDGGGSTGGAAAAAGGSAGINITLTGGGRYSRDEVMSILDSINEYYGDTGKINSVRAA